MFKIRFLCQKAPDSVEHDEKSVEAEAGELLTQVAYRAGVVIQQTCGGTPSCTDCKVIVREGLETGFEAPVGAEMRLMGNVSHLTRERLSCQSIVKNASTVYVPSPAAARRSRKIPNKSLRGVNENGQEKKGEQQASKKNGQKNR